MLKRILWLTLAAAVGWLIWTRLRQRQDEYARTTPQFAPPHTFSPAIESPTIEGPPARQASQDDSLAATVEPALPAGDQPPAVALAAAEAPSPASDDEITTEVLGYCMRCKTKRPIQNPHHETTESGRPAARGTCPVCGAKMFTFLKDDGE